MSTKSLPRLEIHLLGAPQVKCGESDGARGMPVKAQALLYYLAATGQTHTRAALAHLLWSEHDEEDARGNLRKAIQELRRHFDPYLAIDYHSVGFVSPQVYWVDAAEFGVGASKVPSVNSERVQAALALYRADFLDGFHVRDAPEFEAWLLRERERLRELIMQGLSALAEYRAAKGDLAEAIAALRRLLELEPWREEAHRQLMTWLAQSGQRNAALLQYAVCCRVLAEELGVEPEKATRELHTRMLQAEVAAPSAGPQVTVVEYTLVGRRPEWEILKRAWAEITKSGVQMVLIAGEAGIGKTRLAEELLVHVQRQGYATARARAYALEGRLVYTPLAEWLRSPPLQGRLARLNRVWLCEVSRLLPELLIQYPDLPAPEPLTERWQQKRLFEALRHAFLEEEEALLLLLDDLQWCDGETLAWLQYLLESAPDAPLLVIGTVRSDELYEDHPLHKLSRALLRAGKLTTVDLAPLSSEETAVLGAQVREHVLDNVAASRLYQAAAGNPLFVVETARAGDAVIGTSAGSTLDPAPAGSHAVLHDPYACLPPKIYAVIAARLAQLSPHARTLVQVAATIGHAFTLPLLMEASGESADITVRGLDELWQRHIIVEQGGSSYDFTHDRIRDVAHAECSPVKREHFHRRVAQALEKLHAGDLDLVAGELAVHYQYAGAWEEAFAYFRRAAEAAKHLCALRSEAAHLQKAIAAVQLLPRGAVETSVEIELWYELGLAQLLMEWGSEAAATCFRKAGELAAQAGRLADRCHALGWLALIILDQGKLREARTLYELALPLAQEADDVSVFDRLSSDFGLVHYHSGDFMRALGAYRTHPACSGDAEQMAHAWARGELPSSLFEGEAKCYWLLGFPDRAFVYGRHLLRVEHQHINQMMRTTGLAYIGMVFYFLRDAAEVLKVGEKAVAMATAHDIPALALQSELLCGWALAQQGAVEQGLRMVRKVRCEERRLKLRIYEPLSRSLLAEVLALAGEWEEALDEVTESLADAEIIGNYFWNAHLLKLQGGFHASTIVVGGISGGVLSARDCYGTRARGKVA